MADDYSELLKTYDGCKEDACTTVIEDEMATAIRALVAENERLREALKMLTGRSLCLSHEYNTWELNNGVKQHANIALGITAPRDVSDANADRDDWDEDVQILMDRDRE